MMVPSDWDYMNVFQEEVEPSQPHCGKSEGKNNLVPLKSLFQHLAELLRTLDITRGNIRIGGRRGRKGK